MKWINIAINALSASQSWSSYWTQQTDLWIKSKSGMSLLDDYGNNPSVLMPTIITDGYSTYSDTGVNAVANTVWLVKGKINNTTINRWQGAQNTGHNTRFFFGTGTQANTINFAWGSISVVAANDKEHDFDWHWFLIYDKKFWILNNDFIASDAAILNVISTQTLTIEHSAASFSGTPSTIQYGRIKLPNYAYFEYAESKIGTITDGAISWQRHHIFGGSIKYTYDALASSNKTEWIFDGKLSSGYSLYASSYIPSNGYSLYLDDNGDNNRILIPYINGLPAESPTLPSGYSLFANYSSSNLFILDCKIRFTAGSFFDKSSTEIFNSKARGTLYDISNPTDWFGYELNRIKFDDYLNVNYLYRPFIRYNEDSDDKYPIEILVAKTNLIAKKNNVLANYCNDEDPAITITQLDLHIDSQNGDKLFGYDTNDHIFYSSDGGANYITKDFVGSENIGMSFVFNNGNILWGDNEKFYLSTDGLTSYSEVQILTHNGNVFPTITGIKNFVNVRLVDSQILTDGRQLITFGSYINVIDDGYVCLFRSINGANVKVAYMFGKNPTYSNYGDAGNSVIARHVHSSIFCASNGKWYWNTGDHGSDPNFECHFFESVYNENDDTWTNTILLSSDATGHIKSGALFEDNGMLYFGSDSTAAPGTTIEMGMYKCSADNLGTLGDHVRIFNYADSIISGHLIFGKTGLAFPAGIPYDSGLYKILTYDRLIPFTYKVHSFSADPEQTNPDTYVAWKLIKVNENKILANCMRVTDSQYIYKTIMIERN